jgi:hypothetical protein
MDLSATLYPQSTNALRRLLFLPIRGVEEPSLGDTYCAISALRLLNAEIPNPRKTVEFLTQSRLFGVTYLYFYMFTLDRLCPTLRMSPQTIEQVDSIAPDARYRPEMSDWLESTRKALRLKRHLRPLPDPSSPPPIERSVAMTA